MAICAPASNNPPATVKGRSLELTKSMAMSQGPLGPVSALRETSVVFAALIGQLVFKERPGAYRSITCVIVAIAAVCRGQAGASRQSLLLR